MDKKSEASKPDGFAPAIREKRVLRFWKEQDIFRKTLERNKDGPRFVFYDGPPFATGLPHYGHVLPGTIKDVIPRFQTMRGKNVRRVWGWDCHGLPIENLIEKELHLNTKKDIEQYGIGTFNESARSRVLRYAEDWKEIIPRTGRFVDMDRAYETMHPHYTESIWWAFAELYKKELLYEGFKPMYLCPRCETTLSNFEVSQGYVDVTDISVTVPFALRDEPNTFLLAWTTTAWTLPGNVALAVHPEMLYATVLHEGKKYIVASERVKDVFGDAVRVEKEQKGSDLVGRVYLPLFSYFDTASLAHHANAWKIYPADFVTAESGTGIVHIAPGFGGDDLALAEKYHLPIVHHVKFDGTFTDEVIDFQDLPVKKKGDSQSADIAIIKHLAGRGVLFAKQKIVHSYPLCWRCDTPLINYATTSWFVRVSALRDRLLEENKKVRWVPEAVGAGRFEKGLESAPDWAISRSRYWGAPLPVWVDAKGKHTVIGSVEALKQHVKKSGNTYIVMRHAEAESNVLGIMSSATDNTHRLTERGRMVAIKSARELKEKNIDVIIASPLMRARETAEIVARELGKDVEVIVYDDRLREIEAGEFEGKTIDEYHQGYYGVKDIFEDSPEGGESMRAVKVRMGDFLYELEKTYSDKNVLIVTHGGPMFALRSVALGLSREQMLTLREDGGGYVGPGLFLTIPFTPLPHNEEYALDLHRPYIDEIALFDDSGARLSRVSEVFDCWFESGSMPFAEHHYPFEKKDIFDPEDAVGYPADFIAESLDQTRGWFYSLMVLGTALFGISPYRSVVVSGMILAEDGRKMSKRLNNYPNLLDVIDKYGADALRYYLLASPAVRGESINFSEKGVDEVAKKVIGRLCNVYSFLELYRSNEVFLVRPQSTNVLDRWIFVRLDELVSTVTIALEQYELDKATRPIGDFVDDLSTWYVRRSRERFKEDNDIDDASSALHTIGSVLRELAGIMAPLMPFVSEHIFRQLRSQTDPESVHLLDWPKEHEQSEDDRLVLKTMAMVREICSLALEARSRAGINVRQPLGELTVFGVKIIDDKYLALIKDEVNVKQISCRDDANFYVELNEVLTPALREEGSVRELVRLLQGARKEHNLSPRDIAELVIFSENAGTVAFLEQHQGELEKRTATKLLIRQNNGKEVQAGEHTYLYTIA